MHLSAKNNYIKRLGEIAAGVTRLASEMDVFTSNEPDIRYVHQGIPLAIPGTLCEKHHGLIASLLKHEGWSDKLAECFLDKELRTIYANYLVKPCHAVLSEGMERIAALYDELKAEVVILIPLAGIEMSMESFAVGQVIFRRMDTDGFAKLIAGEKIDPSSEVVRKSVETFWRGEAHAILAECRVTASPERAEERAFDECRRALDVLRYAQRVLSNWPDKTAFGFDHEPVFRERSYVFTLEDASIGFSKWNMRNVGKMELKITEQSNPLLEQIGVFKLSSVLAKKVCELSEFEEIVLRALRWYSIAVKTIESENRFLNYITCLETFFTPKSREPISNAIAEGCAFVLGDSIESRKGLFKRIKELYGSRSGLSHGGKTAVLESEVREMDFISWHLLFWMISKIDQFANRQSLQEWIETQKFR